MPKTLTKLPFYIGAILNARYQTMSQKYLDALADDTALEQYIQGKAEERKMPPRNQRQAFVRQWVKDMGLDHGFPERMREIFDNLRNVSSDVLGVALDEIGLSLIEAHKTNLPQSNFEIYFTARVGTVIADSFEAIRAWIQSHENQNPQGLFLSFENDVLLLKKPIVN
jgi:hypothetical protein